MSHLVSFVFPPGCPSQVGSYVVMRISVTVSDLMFGGWRITMKSRAYKTMDLE